MRIGLWLLKTITEFAPFHVLEISLLVLRKCFQFEFKCVFLLCSNNVGVNSCLCILVGFLVSALVFRVMQSMVTANVDAVNDSHGSNHARSL